MKRKKIVIVSLIIIVLSLLVLFLLKTEDRILIARTIIIQKGLSAKNIAKNLEEEGIIKNQTVFLILAKISGASSRFKAGEYELNNRMKMTEIIERLKRGKTIIHRLIIPEGYTLKDIANLLEKNGFANKYKFLNLCYDPTFIDKLSINSSSLEGYLFPDTYFLHKGMDEEEIISLMVTRFNEVVKKEIKDDSIHKIITLASIIEKEAKIKEEYSIISAVFQNRLKMGMPLESCATVLYASGERKEWLSTQDTKIPSPYNTYLQPGLPQGPICNPGMTAIKAALSPADVDYLYFVSNGDGSHTFSKTGREHIFYKNNRTN
ncbi:MAG: endolytic transglycosylase MltG [bacterium]